MKPKILIDQKMTALGLLETLGTVVESQGKTYYRMDAILEQVGEETFVVHFDNDRDDPLYLTDIRKDFIQSRRGLSEMGKNFLGEKLTIEQLTSGTPVVLIDGKDYHVGDVIKEWDGVFVPVVPIISDGLNFYRADILQIRLIEKEGE